MERTTTRMPSPLEVSTAWGSETQGSYGCWVTQEILRQSRRATVIPGLSPVVNPPPFFFPFLPDQSEVGRSQVWLVRSLRSSSSGSSYSSSSGAVARTDTKLPNQRTDPKGNLLVLRSRRRLHPRTARVFRLRSRMLSSHHMRVFFIVGVATAG